MQANTKKYKEPINYWTMKLILQIYENNSNQNYTDE
jgi:hypothetical protein